MAQPYSFSRYNMYMQKLGRHDYIKVETLTKTIQGRSVDLLTITNPKNLIDAGGDQREERVKEKEVARSDNAGNASSETNKEEAADAEEEINKGSQSPDGRPPALYYPLLTFRPHSRPTLTLLTNMLCTRLCVRPYFPSPIRYASPVNSAVSPERICLIAD